MEAHRSIIVRQLPNALSLARLAAVPVFVYLLLASVHGGGIDSNPHSSAAAIVFIAAAWTDFFDGFIARRAGVMSQFGKVVDPAADRLLVGSAAVLVSLYDSRLPNWAFLLVVSRDLLAVLGFLLVRRKLLPDVSRTGKLGTALMMAGLGMLLAFATGSWQLWLFWGGFAVSLAAFVQYVRRYRGSIFRRAPEGPSSSVCFGARPPLGERGVAESGDESSGTAS